MRSTPSTDHGDAANQSMSNDWRSQITIEPGRRGGRSCVRGMRITVYDVHSYLAAGMTPDEIVDDLPYLTKEDIQACLAFAAERERTMIGQSHEAAVQSNPRRNAL